MLKYKHMRLDQEKIDRARKILGTRTETEALNRALDRVIQQDQERVRRIKLMKRITELRTQIGKMKEDSLEWVRLAREERIKSYEGGR